MPPHPRPDGPLRPAAAQINEAIRQLIEQPDDDRRAEEYRRLLIAWAEATRSDMVKAA
ncbi:MULTISPECIES: hypothetical protein [unclassified Streptomyces]|uniref:hypothetical protein n=1 Tax=unclassified Streptomyces TaxID=2593676 RepID=UPI003444FA08